MKSTRREFLKRSLVSLAASTTLTKLSAKALDNSLESFHLQVVKIIQGIAGSKSAVLRVMLPEGSDSNILPIARYFTQLTGIEIELFHVPVDDINTRMFLATNTNQNLYDIALAATFGIPDLVEGGCIANLSTYKEKYEPEGFTASSLYTVGDSYRDAFYGYQTDGDVYLMFYNQLLLNLEKRQEFETAFGKTYSVPSTWEELDAHMKFFHQPDRGLYGGALFRTPDYLVWEWWARFHAKGVLPLNDDLAPNIHLPEGVQALEELILASNSLYPDAVSNGLFENWKAYSKGNIYANIGWGGTQKYLNQEQSKVKKNLLFSPTPGGKVNGKTNTVHYFNWGWNYTVAKNSKVQELAYLFTLFATAPVPSTVAVRAQDGFFDPFRSEHYHDSKIVEIYSADFLKAHRKSMENCLPDFYLHGQSLYFSELKKYLSLALDGQLSPKEALDTARKRWEKIHVKKGLKKQTEQWIFLKQLYPNNS